MNENESRKHAIIISIATLLSGARVEPQRRRAAHVHTAVTHPLGVPGRRVLPIAGKVAGRGGSRGQKGGAQKKPKTINENE